MLFAELTDYFAQLEATRSRNAMVAILAEVFKQTQPAEIAQIVLLVQGRIVPPYETLEFGVGESTVAEALARVANRQKPDVQRRFSALGDYGLVASELFGGDDGGLNMPEKPETLPATEQIQMALDEEPAGDEAPAYVHPSSGLTVGEVFQELDKLARTSGSGSAAAKLDLLVNLLSGMKGSEAKYLLRIVLGELRLGVGDPTMMDAMSVVKTGDKSKRKALERAYNLCSDLSLVARTLWEDGLEAVEQIHVQVGRPVRPALAERSSGAAEIIERLGRCSVEPKLDGFRCQVHKRGDEVKVFSRNLEDFSNMFPEIIAATKQLPVATAIFEGEAIAYDPATGDYFPFQVTVQRKRKHDIAQMQEKYPLRLITFDLLYYDGEDYTPRPYVERREQLRQLVSVDTNDVIDITPAIVTDNVAEVEAFFADSITRGLEGIVAKRLDAPYQAGKRDFNWIKLKRSYQGHLSDTIDCVIIGYWYGRGQRAKLGIGSLLTAVYDPKSDTFSTVSRMATGPSEQEWIELKQMLDEITVEHVPARVDSIIQPEVWSEPAYVITVQADEITRSPIHTAGRTEDELGYALRFPRLVGGIRTDKRPEDATTVEEIIHLYQLQGYKSTTDSEG